MEGGFGWTIQCPDDYYRRRPYTEKSDATFDAMYLTARGCFDYADKLIEPFDPPCPQGDHVVNICMYDEGVAMTGAILGPCDIDTCRRQAKWRVGLVLYSEEKDVEIKCNIATKTCNLHQINVDITDLVSVKEWDLITKQFLGKGVKLSQTRDAGLYFLELQAY